MSLDALFTDVVSTLEASHLSQRKTKRMARDLKTMSARAAKLHKQGQDMVDLEGALQELLALVERQSPRGVLVERQSPRGVVDSPSTRVLSWVYSRQTRPALEESEKALYRVLAAYERRDGEADVVALGNTHRTENAADAQADLDGVKGDIVEAVNARALEPEVGDRVLAELDDFDVEDIESELSGQSSHGTSPLLGTVVLLTRSLTAADNSAHASIRPGDLDIDEQQLLGRGSFGEVLVGALRRTGTSGATPVAVKRVSSDESVLPFQEQVALRREAARWRTLDHKNVLRLEGTCVQHGRLLLVMELCDMSVHKLLYEHMPDAPLSLEEKGTIIKGIARGMAYLHARNIIHRDIKPANVLLSYDLGRVKVADFGLSTAKARANARAQTFSAAGSPPYMAPEVMQPPAVWTTRADVYSFAITAWEIIHRRAPWSAAGHGASGSTTTPLAPLVERVRVQGERPAISDNVDVKLWMVNLMQSCWQGAAKQRPYSSEVLSIVEQNTRKRRSTRILKDMLAFVRGSTNSARAATGSSARLARNADTAPQPAQDASRRGSALRGVGSLTSSLLETSLHGRARGGTDAGSQLGAGRPAGGRPSTRPAETGLADEPLLRELLADLYAPDPSVETVQEVARLLSSDQRNMEDEDPALYKLREIAWSEGAIYDLVRLLQTAESPEMAEACCMALRFIPRVVDHEPRRQLLRDLRGGQQLVATMADFIEHPRVQRWGCAALGVLASSAENRITLLKLGAGTAVLTAMRAHPRDRSVQERGCRALWSLSVNADENKAALVDAGAGEDVVAAMRGHANDARVQEYACMALTALAATEKNQARLMSLGIGLDLVAAMRTHVGDPRVQENACAALYNLADSEAVRAALLDLGVGEDVLRAMAGHRPDVGVQDSACRALMSLSSSRSAQKLLMQLGAAQAVLAAMRAHVKSAKVLERACSAIVRLVVGSEGDKETFVTLGAGEAIASAMREHPADARMQEAACRAVMSLAGDAKTHGDLRAAGIAGDVLNAMRALPSAGALQESACGALYNLSVDDSVARQQLIEADAGKDVLRAMRALESDPRVQEYCCRALRSFAGDDKYCAKLLKMGAGNDVIKAMRAHADDANVQKNACGALYVFASRDPKQRGAVRALGVEEPVLAALTGFPRNRRLQYLGIALLLALCSDNKAFFDLVNAKGALQVIEDARDAFAQQQDVQQVVNAYFALFISA